MPTIIISNLEKYKDDLNKLISTGQKLFWAMKANHSPDKFETKMRDVLKGDFEENFPTLKKNLPSFRAEYQSWYSESLAIIKILLPDRVNDFVKFYEKPKNRKEISWENYVIEDYLQGHIITKGGKKVVGPEVAIPQFYQQLKILESAKKRFESSLFDIKQLVQADLFDSEIGSSRELNKKGFTRAAGAVAGVVLEKHLAQVCKNHNIKILKQNPSINDYNQSLKDNDIIEVST